MYFKCINILSRYIGHCSTYYLIIYEVSLQYKSLDIQFWIYVRITQKCVCFE